jgi:hypothetical protein
VATTPPGNRGAALFVGVHRAGVPAQGTAQGRALGQAAEPGGCWVGQAGAPGLRLCALGSGPAGLHCPARTGRENLPQASLSAIPQVSGAYLTRRLPQGVYPCPPTFDRAVMRVPHPVRVSGSM